MPERFCAMYEKCKLLNITYILARNIEYVHITMPERLCAMYEKCKFLRMGDISALTKASVLMWSKNVCL